MWPLKILGASGDICHQPIQPPARPSVSSVVSPPTVSPRSLLDAEATIVPAAPQPAPEAGTASALYRQIQRAFLLIAALCCAVGLLESLLLPQQVGAPSFGVLSAGYGALALLGLAGLRMRPQQAAVLRLALLAGACSLVALAGWSGGWTLAEPGLPLLVVAVCMVSAAGTPGVAAAAALMALAVVAGLGWATPTGLSGTGAGLVSARPPLPAHLLGLGAAVLAAVAVGQVLGRLLEQQLAETERRDERLQALLSLTADAHWETDAELRLQRLQHRLHQGGFRDLSDALGRRPWDLPLLVIDEDTLDLVRADVDAREPLRDMPMWWRCTTGERRHFLVSGQPRFDAQGQFAGYWGVARDVSAEQQMQDALHDSEQRYAALMAGVPTALVLHRHGHILEANPAAAQLLGYPHAQALRGHDLLAEHMDDEQRDLAMDRLDELDADPALQALPAVPRLLRRRDGSTVPTLAGDLRSDLAGRPATLAVYLDDGARHAALGAQQRSEALLSRVLALGTEALVLAELHGAGRYLMVSAGFAQLCGRPRHALQGQPVAALGLWHDPEDYQHLVERVRRDGAVHELPLCLRSADGRQHMLLCSASRLQLEDEALLLLQVRALAEGRGPVDDRAPRQQALLAGTRDLLRPALGGLLEQLQQARQLPEADAGRRQQALARVDAHAQALATRLDDLLDLARLEAGTLALSPVPFSPRELLQSLQQACAPLAVGRGLAFSLHMDPALPAQLVGDAPRLWQLLVRLLQHALGHTRQGGIRLVARAQPGGRLRVEVHDTGPGLDAAAQARLMEPPALADALAAGPASGQLGLALAVRLAAAMGGRLTLRSAPGQGSSFHLQLPSLPIVPVAPAPAAAAVARAVPVMGPAEPPMLRHVMAATAGGAGPLQGQRVLLIGEAPGLVPLLAAWSLQLTRVSGLPQALALLAPAPATAPPFDLVAVALDTPGLQPADLLARLRRLYPAERLPVLALLAGPAAGAPGAPGRASAAADDDRLAAGFDARLPMTPTPTPAALDAVLRQLLVRPPVPV